MQKKEVDAEPTLDPWSSYKYDTVDWSITGRLKKVGVTYCSPVLAYYYIFLRALSIMVGDVVLVQTVEIGSNNSSAFKTYSEASESAELLSNGSDQGRFDGSVITHERCDIDPPSPRGKTCATVV